MFLITQAYRVRGSWIGSLSLAVLVLVLELPDAVAASSSKGMLVVVGAAGLMPLSRRHPVPVALLVGVLYVVGFQAPDYDAPVSASLIALYQVGRHSSAAASAAVAVVGMATSWWLLAQPILTESLSMGLSVVLTPSGPILAGYIVHLRTELARRREQQATEHAVREERRRIARELHDVIAHHVSVINLYMGVARDPGRRRTRPAGPAHRRGHGQAGDGRDAAVTRRPSR
jgi:signal transduction histidine kinase